MSKKRPPDGLIYLINRYYDPATGQFISVDPAVSETGQPYAYTDDNPVNATDPSGLATLGVCLGGGGYLGYLGARIHLAAGGCLTRTIDSSGDDDIGVSRTFYGGGGVGAGASVGVYYEVSNATNLQQLTKWFNYVGGSGDIGIGGSAMLFWGKNNGKTIYGFDVGISTGAAGDAAVGRSYTWVNQFRSDWVANPARWVWDYFTGGVPWKGAGTLSKLLTEAWVRIFPYIE